MNHSDITFDTTIRPQDDFFGYVNNSWLKSHPIPKSETRWGTFNILRDEAWQAMQHIYENLEHSSYENGTVEQQARDFYYTGMHLDELEHTHLDQVSSLFTLIDMIATPSDLSAVMGRLQAINITGPWSTYVDSDHDDNTKHIFHFDQSGLTLPNRDYYLEDSEKMVHIRKSYQSYAIGVYEHFPELADSAESFWQRLIEFETEIARVSRSSADLRDVEKNYNKVTYRELESTYSSIDWKRYAKELGWQPSDQITVDQPEFMAFVNRSMTERPIDEWKLYLKWRVLCNCLSKISMRFAQLHFEFFGRILSGTTEMMPTWKRVVLAAEYTLGEATGKLYAEKYFPESSKQQVLSIVEQVRNAYGERIEALDWMSDDTKRYAQKKLANMKVLIGYPDVWRDFSGLRITQTSYLGNILEGQRFEVAYWLKRLHEPTSREDWFMTPQTVNAYHDPNRLVICFPAGILQSPFFDPKASFAANMGGIGTVIGHELSHGFDDQGCMFDAEGNVRTWQNDEERATFSEKAQIIINQANNFEVLPGLNLKGKLVIGESIADLGGVELSLHALKKHVTDEELHQALKEFFINYAFTECTNTREEKQREYALTDPHPASEFRVNGILRHVDMFYSAFDVKDSDMLYLHPDSRARIW